MTHFPVYLHIAAGLIGLAAGAIALCALKGAQLHRKSGMIFVYATLAMAASGAVLAAFKPDRLSVIAGVLTFYLVITALLAVRRSVPGFRWMDIGTLLSALVIGIASVQLGFAALDSPTGEIDGQPAAPAFFFGAVALIAVLGDIRLVLAKGISGARRIARHLWRMCFALFIAVASFFLGQAQVFPVPIRNSGLLAIPVLVVLFLMLYWLARVLFSKQYRRV